MANKKILKNRCKHKKHQQKTKANEKKKQKT